MDKAINWCLCSDSGPVVLLSPEQQNRGEDSVLGMEIQSAQLPAVLLFFFGYQVQALFQPRSLSSD
jgi:hypothetical protein